MKPGYKTTEFWVTVIFDAGLAVTSLTSTNILPPKYATLAVGLANGLYAISRGLAKYGPEVKVLTRTVPAAPAPAPVEPPTPPAA